MNQEQKLGSQGLQQLHQKLHDQNIPHNCYAYERAIKEQFVRELQSTADWPIYLWYCWPNWNN